MELSKLEVFKCRLHGLGLLLWVLMFIKIIDLFKVSLSFKINIQIIFVSTIKV